MKNALCSSWYKAIAAFIVVMCSISFLIGIDSVAGSGADISDGFSVGRDRSFAYHSGMDELHWYGTNKWAVRFNFSSVYPSYDEAAFIISQAQLYFPSLQATAPFDSVDIEIWSDLAGLPHERKYYSGKTAVTSHWVNVDIPASQQDTISVAWLVVDYNTNFAGPYVSASTGDGTHSYFWNTNVPEVPYFQNMATSGFNCEFLFGVRGRFELSDTDVELLSIDLIPAPAVGIRVSPAFTIINNSGQTINEATLNITLSAPDSLLLLEDVIQIATPILPYAELTVLADNPLYTGHTYQLPGTPAQLKLRAVLHIDAQADTVSNNTITRYYNCFSRGMPVHLVENFIRSSESANLLTAQDNLLPDNTTALNFFPLTNDFYYSLGSYQRFNWYGFNGLPMTVLDGNTIIPGFIDETLYSGLFSAAADVIQSQNTFLELSDSSINLPDPPNQLQVRASFRNSSTHLFDNVSDPSLIRQSRFFAGLFQKEMLYGERLIFRRWGAYADTIGTAIGINETYMKEFSISLQDIPQDSLTTDFMIVYWIQHIPTKQVVYANSMDLTHVDNEDDTLPSLQDKLIIAPNPASIGKTVTLSLPAGFKSKTVHCTIYNLKGQAVSKQTLDSKSLQLDTTKIPSAGLYIISIDIPSQGKTKHLSKRLIIF